MEKATVDFKSLAQDAMLTGKVDYARFGIVYRTGKGLDDVKHAHKKALKNGMGKIEYEISMFEVYLKGIFKAGKAAT